MSRVTIHKFQATKLAPDARGESDAFRVDADATVVTDEGRAREHFEVVVRASAADDAVAKVRDLYRRSGWDIPGVGAA